MAFLRAIPPWGDGAILPNATCTALAGQDPAVPTSSKDGAHAATGASRDSRYAPDRRTGRHPACRSGTGGANTGAHQRDPVAMAHAVAARRKLTNGTGNTTFLFRGLYRPVYGCRETYLAGPSTRPPSRGGAVPVTGSQNRGSPVVAVHDDRWHQFLDFEATVEEVLLRKGA